LGEAGVFGGLGVAEAAAGAAPVGAAGASGAVSGVAGARRAPGNVRADCGKAAAAADVGDGLAAAVVEGSEGGVGCGGAEDGDDVVLGEADVGAEGGAWWRGGARREGAVE